MADTRNEVNDLLARIPEENLSKAKDVLNPLVRKTTSIHSSHLNPDDDDIPIGEDQSGRKELVETVASMIESATPPFTFCINGKWGSGKTVFMKWVRREIDSTYGSKVCSIWFDAWKYESLGNIVYPLLRELESLTPKRRWTKKVGALLASVGAFFAYVIAIFALGFVPPIGIASRVWNSFKKDYEGNQRDYEILRKLRSDFAKFVQYILRGGIRRKARKEKVVIFIDDLDRCLPHNVIRLLESIKNFFSIEGCVFVVAIDREFVSDGVMIEYGNTTTFDGEQYLEKTKTRRRAC